jgi:hypothetical protein
MRNMLTRIGFSDEVPRGTLRLAFCNGSGKLISDRSESRGPPSGERTSDP